MPGRVFYIMKKTTKESPNWKLLFLTVSAIAFYALFSLRFGFFDVPSARINDFFVRLAANVRQTPEQLDDFIILTVDNDSVDFSNMRWPWRRGFMADILRDVSESEPKAVFFDFVLTGRSEPSEDEHLQETLYNMGNVIIASFINENGLPVIPHPVFTEAAYSYGFINNPFDKDDIIRRSRVMSLSKLSVDERAGDYSAVVKLFAFAQGLSGDDLYFSKSKLSIDSKRTNRSFPVRLNNDRTMEVNYAFSPDKFNIVPAWKVFKRQLPQGVFKDKLVLMGVTAELTHDMYRTPLGILPGIMIKAYELATMLTGRYVTRLPYAVEYVIFVVLLFFVAIFSYRFILGRGFLVFCILMLCYYFFYFAAVINNIYTDGFAPVFLGALLYIGANFYKQVRLRRDINKLQLLAVTDSLTGLYLRRYFQLRLKYEWSHARKTKAPFSLLMLDIDFFKKINDTYGHTCGDLVLSKVSGIIKECCRKVDIICRYGGEEFAIILPQTDHEGAGFLAEKIRATVETMSFDYDGQTINASVSCGIATYGKHEVEAPEELITLADDCLYKAKESGRNRVITCIDTCG